MDSGVLQLRGLHVLKDQELLERTRALSREERQITLLLLDHIKEVERRELHLERGYGGLLTWACQELGYTEDQAQYRINAMRTIRDVPEAEVALEQGRLSLTHLVKAHRFFEAERKRGKPYSQEAKLGVLTELEGTSTRECDRRLAEKSPEPLYMESARAVVGGRMQITFTAGPELAVELERLRSTWGCESYADLFERMTRIVTKKTVAPQLSVSVGNERVENKSAKSKLPQKDLAEKDSAEESRAVITRYIPRATRKQVWRRDGGQCSYVSPETGKRCGSHFALQFDHRYPFALGGSHSADNLRILCRAHNSWSGRKMFGNKR